MKRILFWSGIGVAAVLLIAYAAWPRPLEVETAGAKRGPIEAVVTEEAETRLDDEYVVSMPVTGRLLRLKLVEGDTVEKGSLIAQVDTFERKEQLKRLESRVREIEAMIVGVDEAKPKPDEIRAAELSVEAAKIRKSLARKALEVARINAEQEEKEYRRMEKLLADKAVSESAYEEAKRRYLTFKTQYDQAVLDEQVADKALEQATVKLKRLRESVGDNEYQRTAYQAQIRQVEAGMAVLKDELAKSEIRAPVSGPVLENYQEDERILPAGTPIMKIGDLASICIESDILSEEVGSLKVGQEVVILGPAVGSDPIMGKVERIYPAGFEKISSLGIEQQRVKVIVAFDNASLQLRPGVRLDIEIVTERRENALLVPERALFRVGGQWHVFVVNGRRATLTSVEVGLRTDESAQITKGLQAGDFVIPSPPTELSDGMAVVPKSED